MECKNNTIVLDNNKDVVKFMVISDTHLCCKQERLDLLEYFYEKAERLNVDFVIHCGDVVDGYLPYRLQQENLLYNTYEEQKEYVIAFYPKSLIPTIMISGNHDMSWLKLNNQDILADIVSKRNDLLYLGGSYGIITIGNLNIVLVHGQHELKRDLKKVDCNPNFVFRGHKHMYDTYSVNNFKVIQVPCLVDCTISYAKHKQKFSLGAYYIEISPSLHKIVSNSLVVCESRSLKRTLHIK